MLKSGLAHRWRCSLPRRSCWKPWTNLLYQLTKLIAGWDVRSMEEIALYWCDLPIFSAAFCTHRVVVLSHPFTPWLDHVNKFSQNDFNPSRSSHLHPPPSTISWDTINSAGSTLQILKQSALRLNTVQSGPWQQPNAQLASTPLRSIQIAPLADCRDRRWRMFMQHKAIPYEYLEYKLKL